MKKIFVFSLILLLAMPVFVLSDGIPYPPIRPYISEEHQIVLVEQKGNEIITTLDLGIKSKPANIFSLLEEDVYINDYNPIWLKTFLLPKNFKPKKLCISSYDFRYYRSDISPLEVTINDEKMYLYTKEKDGLIVYPAEAGEKIIMPPPDRTGNTFCLFVRNKNMTKPIFVDVSRYFTPGEYNTVEIRVTEKYRGYSINKAYLQSGEAVSKVKVIIPFKGLPKSIEVGGRGINIWELERIFGEKRYWYGYYEGRLLSAKEAPALAGRAMDVEESVKSVVSATEVSADVKGRFGGKVSDVLGETISASGLSKNEYVVVRFADVSYEVYMDYNAYVLELTVEPYEFKRIVVKWIEEVYDKDDFDYYYPLGTGQTWSENIPYTAIYVKIPGDKAIKFSSIPGNEEATENKYRYYRWKFVDSKPDKDLYITVSKLTKPEEWLQGVKVWLREHIMAAAIIGGLALIGLVISLRSKKVGKEI